MRDACGDFPVSWVCFGLGAGHSPPLWWSRGLPFPVSAGYLPPSVLLKHRQGLLFLTNLISFMAWFGRICRCLGGEGALAAAAAGCWWSDLPWQGHPRESFDRTRGFIPVSRQSRPELKGQRRSAFQIGRAHV